MSYEYAAMKRQDTLDARARSVLKGVGLSDEHFYSVTFAREGECDPVKVKHALEALADANQPWNALTLTDREIDHGMFQSIGRITRLRSLTLRSTRFRDEDLVALKSLKKLERINVIDTPISGVGLEQLWYLPNLREVHIADTKVTQRDVARLHSKRPDVEFDKPEYLAELPP